MRVLLFATTTGYQVRAFDEAAAALGVELQLATDRCDQLEDPWRDRAIAVRFHEPALAVDTIAAFAKAMPVDGVLAVGDRPATMAAAVAEALRLPWHSHAAAQATRSKLRTRQRLRDAGLPVPDFGVVGSEHDLAAWADRGPVVVKPVVLSGSRGVIRADTPTTLRRAWARVSQLLAQPDIRAMRDPDSAFILVETFIPGREFAVEGLLSHGRLQVLAIFDKPDPLYGPYFEETLYVTPSRASARVQRAMESAVDAACRALGLTHGPIHAECRVNDHGVFILEVAARPIGGICARALRFKGPKGATATLEALLLRHAIGARVDRWTREPGASGVMMIPIPGPGVLRGMDGVDRARAVPGIDDVVLTAKVDQTLVPLPEGATYLGFIFARADSPSDVESALRTAHACLAVRMDRAVPVI
ncbi:MAG: ATP-grasp domain-containing protein [Vicinamibacteria bacterium]|nr:ATP-grasp domain-containing protein [Vicinamibacteria bacterium]